MKKVLEMLVMMISKFHEHDDIGIGIRNSFFDPCIVSIVFVNIFKQNFEASGLYCLTKWFLDIKMIKLSAVPKKQKTEGQKRYSSKITICRKTISCFHFFPERDKSDDVKNPRKSYYIRQETNQ